MYVTDLTEAQVRVKYENSKANFRGGVLKIDRRRSQKSWRATVEIHQF